MTLGTLIIAVLSSGVQFRDAESLSWVDGVSWVEPPQPADPMAGAAGGLGLEDDLALAADGVGAAAESLFIAVLKVPTTIRCVNGRTLAVPLLAVP